MQDKVAGPDGSGLSEGLGLEVDAGGVGPGATLYEVTYTHGHRTLNAGDLVLVRMVEDPRFNNLLLRTDWTLHPLADEHDQYVHLRRVAPMQGNEQPPQTAGGTPVDRRGRRVVCAANLYGNGVMLVGPRHFDATMRDQFRRFGLKHGEPHVQGFIDQWGEFLTREEALKVATEQGQILRRCGGDDCELFSENLY